MSFVLDLENPYPSEKTNLPDISGIFVQFVYHQPRCFFGEQADCNE